MSEVLEKFNKARDKANKALKKIENEFLSKYSAISHEVKDAETIYINETVKDKTGNPIKTCDNIVLTMSNEKFLVSGFIIEKDKIKIELRQYSNTHPPKLGKTILPVPYNKPDDFELIII